jgi:endonuclease/exonuclease/phosphatase family metal-dependent hydrolase
MFPKIMTYNIYQGTELVDVVSATTPEEFILGAATDYGHQVSNNFPERAQAIASEVAANHPDLIGLQEVALWRTGPDTNPPTPATTVTYDYLQILLNALSAQGVSYTPLVVRSNFDVQGPALFATGLVDIRLTDRSAILVKSSDLTLPGVSFTNIQSQDYVINTVLTTLAGPVTLLGGWASVDIAVGNVSVARFVSTHLDGFSPLVNNAQALELVAGPLNTWIPEVIMSGDFNAVPGSATYDAVTGIGFTDSWAALHPADLGLTCCQVDQNGGIVDVINNPVSNLLTRVDYVLVRGPIQASDAILVGADPSTRTASGLWPSDHAGLVVTIGMLPVFRH